MNKNWDNFNWPIVDQIWEKYLNYGKPTKVSKVLNIEFDELETIFLEFKVELIDNLIQELADGAVLIVKNTLSKIEIDKIKSQFNDMMINRPSSFHKMFDEVPNFWREISEDVGKQYSIPIAKKAAYFFGHNIDSHELNQIIYPKWRVFKALCGLSPFCYEGLKPSSGIVDRMQIVNYPSGSGFVAPHHDPSHNQRLIISGYPSQRGKDYEGGGFWVMTEKEGQLNVEKEITAGDFGLCYADIIHGVDSTTSGDRWFIGLMTVDSDYVNERATSRKVNN